MSPFSSTVFITLALFLISLVEGPPFEDECDDSSFNAAFYNRSTLFILKNPYVYTWKRDSDSKELFSGKLKSKEHRYRYWPEIDDRITAACSYYNHEDKHQFYVFMNDEMMYFYANEFNEETRIWETFFWEHSLDEIPNHEYFVPTCMMCAAQVRFGRVKGVRRRLIDVEMQFINSDMTEFRWCISTVIYDSGPLIAEKRKLECKPEATLKLNIVEKLEPFLNKTLPCSHLTGEGGGEGTALIFTGDKMIVKLKGESKPLILPVDEILFGCVKPPGFLLEVAIGLMLFIIAVLTTLLPLWYFLLTNPRGDESRSGSKDKGQDDQVEVKESKDSKNERFILEPLSPLRQRIHLQRFRQPVGEEDTIRTIISTG